jgi:phosphohistidine phosphatase
MRHAKAAAEQQHESDFERRLTDDGIRTASETAATLLSHGIQIDRIICSAAERTRQTADLIAAGMQLTAARMDLDELYLAPAKKFEKAICDCPAEDESSVLVVGHNPGIAGLICDWADESLSVSTATVAVFESSADTWHDVRRTKVHIPKLVCLLQHGKVAWPHDETTSDPELLE